MAGHARERQGDNTLSSHHSRGKEKTPRHGREDLTGCAHPVCHGRDRPRRVSVRLFSFLNVIYKVPS